MQLHGDLSPDKVIRAHSSDAQLALHLEEGVACHVLQPMIWKDDTEGLQAIIAEDNMNASVDMATNEMEVLVFLSDHVAAGLPFDECFAAAKTRFGTSAFGEADMKSLYNFAMRVPQNLIKNLAELHFSLIPPALLRCPPRHFGSIARIGGQSAQVPAPHSKALRTYMRKS